MRQVEAHQRVLHEEAKRIAASTTERAYLMKNLKDGDSEELLKVAVNCISNMTGDGTLLKALVRRQPRVCQDAYSYREPIPNIYTKTVDVGAPVMECPECKGRIQSNAFSYAVGNLGYAFCPYCGKDMRKKVNT